MSSIVSPVDTMESSTAIKDNEETKAVAVAPAPAYEEYKIFTEFNHSGPTMIYPTQSAIIPSTHKSVFLAGAIDQGKAPEWQQAMFNTFQTAGLPLVTYNPRRPNWDSSLTQDVGNQTFKEQVKWELDALDSVDYIAMFLPPSTLAPISLLEMGLYARSGRLLVGCDVGFYRRGNVQIVCERLGVPFFNTREELEEAIESRVREDLGLKLARGASASA